MLIFEESGFLNNPVNHWAPKNIVSKMGPEMHSESRVGVVVRDNIPRIDFIKMGIEGSELSALRGGESTIRRCRPKLAISLYHRSEDFFAIPLWIDSLGLGYRFFLEHYSIHHEETVLFSMV